MSTSLLTEPAGFALAVARRAWTGLQAKKKYGKGSMARKKQRKKSWLRILALFLLIPLAVWSIAFLLWFYWYDLSNLFSREGPERASPKPPQQIEKDARRESTPAPQPQEKIFEEDRKKLEDVLKRRN